MTIKTAWNVETACAALLVATVTISPALAQTTPVPAPDSKRVIPEKRGEPLQNGRSDSLSKKLSESDGVIKPGKNIDPGMKTPAPDPTPHSTPVIPPSATGGDTAK